MEDDWTTQWLEADGEDEGTGPPRRRSEARRGSPARRRVVLVVAGLPWLVVVLLLVVPGRFGETGTTAADTDTQGAGSSAETSHRAGADAPRPHTEAVAPSPDEASSDASPPSPAEDTDASEEQPALMELRGGWRVEPGDSAAAVLAVAVARAWLTGVEPRLEIVGIEPPSNDGYAEHLAVEAVERLSADAAVVTVAAIVLEGDDQLRAGLRRLAVPITWSDGQPQPAGAPWPLPPLEPQAHGLPPGEPVTDPDVQLAAVAAVEDAGFADVELLDVEASPTGSVTMARIVARASSGQPVETTVWLRHHLDGFVVAGTTPRDVGPRPSQPDTASEADG